MVDEGLLIKTSRALSLSCGAGDLRCKADMNTMAEHKEESFTHTISMVAANSLYNKHQQLRPNNPFPAISLEVVWLVCFKHNSCTFLNRTLHKLDQ